MKIAIDAVFFQLNEWSGIARYWMNIFNDLDAYCSEHTDLEVFIFVRGNSLSLRNKSFKHLKMIPIHLFDPVCALSDYEELGEICKNIACRLDDILSWPAIPAHVALVEQVDR